MVTSFFDLPEPEPDLTEERKTRKLLSFRESLGSMRKCKFCFFVAQRVIASIRRWCKIDEKERMKVLGTNEEELNALLQMAEESERRGFRR